LSSANSYPVVQGTSGPIGSIVLTEALTGQVQVGDEKSVTITGASSGESIRVLTPSILSRTEVQNVDSPKITEPVKDFFKSGDVVTFTIRDANGNSNTIGLAGVPLVAGGSLTVGVAAGGGAATTVRTGDVAATSIKGLPRPVVAARPGATARA
jgi:hypothetical protein